MAEQNPNVLYADLRADVRILNDAVAGFREEVGEFRKEVKELKDAINQVKLDKAVQDAKLQPQGMITPERIIWALLVIIGYLLKIPIAELLK